VVNALEVLMDARFLTIVAKTLSFEDATGKGVVSRDPKDPGGVTKYGISKRSYPELDIENLTRDDAIAIYYRDYYVKPGLDRIHSDSLAQKIFDFGVTAGPKTAVKALQEALLLLGVTIDQDGVLGPKTVSEANEYHNQFSLLAAMKYCVAEKYLLCNQPYYLDERLPRAMS
jgi:lysozyme family protein